MTDSATSIFTCEMCQSDFVSRNQLFKHIRDVHEDPGAQPAPTSKQQKQKQKQPAPLPGSSGKSSRPGRVARRRNKEERGREGGPCLVSLEGFSHRSPRLSLQDAQTVTHQLGFAPTNLIEVKQK